MEENIQIPDIEAELTRLSKQHQTKGCVRACLFNLIIYVDEKSRASYLHHLVDCIVEKFPCRIIFISGDPTPEQNYIRVTVSNEFIGKAEAGIACDQILIEASLSQLKRVPFIVLPHLVPDLPIYFLWGQDPTTDNAIFPDIGRFAERLIFDSESADKIQLFSQQMLHLMETHPNQEFLDINWALSTGWRFVIANVFDCARSVDWIQNNQGIQIKYNCRQTEWIKHGEIRSLYLMSWLAVQSKWNYKHQKNEKNLRTLTFEYNGHEFEAQLIAEYHEDVPPGAIVGIELSSSDNHKVSISTSPAFSKAIINISSLESCEPAFTMPLPNLKRTFPYIQELFFSSISPQYKDMLRFIASIEW